MLCMSSKHTSNTHYSDNNHYIVYCVSFTDFLAATSVKRGVLLFQEAYRSAESFKILSECDGSSVLNPAIGDNTVLKVIMGPYLYDEPDIGLIP